jgi:hypothetical protein
VHANHENFGKLTGENIESHKSSQIFNRPLKLVFAIKIRIDKAVFGMDCMLFTQL